LLEKFAEYLCCRPVSTADSQYVHAPLRETLKCARYFIGALRDVMVDIRVICDNALYSRKL